MNEIRRLRGVRQPMSALIVGAVLVLCAVASACNPPTLSTPPQLPECPESANWSDFFKATYREMATSTPTAGQLALSGPITDIPEFNDCQRFVVRPGAAFQFDSLFAIFARYRLDSIPVEGIRSQTGAAVIPMATIYSFHSAYPTLGIAPEFNCLYFIGSMTAPSGYEARMVPVAAKQQTCATAPTGSGTPLKVDRIEMPGADDYDYPAVARWDWDDATHTQFIGIRCGRAWCEVRQHGTGATLASTSRYVRSGSVLFRRAVMIKGWHDEQRLALPPSASSTVAKPTEIVATLIPDTLLDQDPVTAPPTATRYNGTWAHVASVGLSAPPGIYATKLNLVQSASPDPVNNVYFCYGKLVGGQSPCFTDDKDIPKCAPGTGGEWWARIESDSAHPRFFCITRRAHPGFKIPGVVRWRWTLHDDTMWVRCLDGCCQVQAGDS